jgi:hypothetical protein
MGQPELVVRTARLADEALVFAAKYRRRMGSSVSLGMAEKVLRSWSVRSLRGMRHYRRHGSLVLT